MLVFGRRLGVAEKASVRTYIEVVRARSHERNQAASTFRMLIVYWNIDQPTANMVRAKIFFAAPVDSLPCMLCVEYVLPCWFECCVSSVMSK